MQEAPRPRSNRERTDTTRQSLVSAARELFVAKGYAGTSTPEVAVAAGLTRGALYHHFRDKRDLLRAVLDREARAVTGEIEAAEPQAASARAALLAGSAAYLDAMTVPGRTRLLLIEGPAVLGVAETRALDQANAARTLGDGLEAAMPDAGRNALSIPVLAMLLSAAFDRGALAVQEGTDPEAVRSTMIALVERVLDHGAAPSA